MRRFPLMLLAAVLAATSFTAVAVVADEGTVAQDSSRRSRSGIVFGDDDGKVVNLDLSDLGETISAAMAGLSEALAEIDTIQVFSDDGCRLVIREGDRETEIDVDEIVRETHEALRLAFAEIGDHLDRGEHAHRAARRHEIRAEVLSERENLRAEISELKKEIESLRSELERVRDKRGR